MQRLNTTYEIDIRDVEFKQNGLTTEQTVIIRKFRDGKKIRTVRYGLVDKDDIYKQIAAGEPVILDRCYVKNFSLSEYRKVYGHEDQGVVSIPEFSAKDAFFESDRDIDFSFASFGGATTDFSETFFAYGNISFYRANFNEGDANFSEVHFGVGDVNFQFANFKKGNVTFENSSFDGGDISFVNTHFGNGKMNFKTVHFGGGDVSFLYARCEDGDKTFERAVFQGNSIDFRKAEFGNGKVDFRRADFGSGSVTFEEAEFKKGRINFRLASFGDGDVSFEMVDFGTGGVNMERAIFGTGKLSFAKTKFDTLILKGTHLNSYVDLRIAKGGTIDLSDTIVRDIIDLHPVDYEVDLDILLLTGMRNLGRIFINYERNKVKNLIGNQTTTSHREKATQFNILKEGLHVNGQYIDEDLAYVAFKRNERVAQQEERLKQNKWNALWAYPYTFVQWLVFDKMGQYATNPMRVLFSMLVVYTLYSLLFLVLPEFVDAGIACAGADHDELSMTVKAFYYSAITFLTIGYGDCLPAGWIKWIAGAEGWTGVFMMSYFTVAFVRRILR